MTSDSNAPAYKGAGDLPCPLCKGLGGTMRHRSDGESHIYVCDKCPGILVE